MIPSGRHFLYARSSARCPENRAPVSEEDNLRASGDDSRWFYGQDMRLQLIQISLWLTVGRTLRLPLIKALQACLAFEVAD